MKKADLKDFLDSKAREYEQRSFVDSDPVAIPHLYVRKEDVEIAGFLTATIAWGNRKSILRSASRMMELMDHSPYEFVMKATDRDRKVLAGFVHRTFNGQDLDYFVTALRHIYKDEGGMEALFARHATSGSLQPAIHGFRKAFFSLPHPKRCQKHLSDPLKNSAAKRLNMFLRWMVRPATAGVDFGLWTTLSPAQLSCPLDVHSGRVARKLRLLKRKQNDAKAVEELDRALRRLDPRDPVKYDYALFGLGVYEQF